MFADLPCWLQDFARNRRKKGRAGAPRDEGAGEPIQTPWRPEVEARLRSALSAIPASDYDIWLRVGMALHHLQWIRSDGTSIGFDLWTEYSARCQEKYSRAVFEEKWESFKRSNGPVVTIGSIFHMAKQYGWTDDDFRTDSEMHEGS